MMLDCGMLTVSSLGRRGFRVSRNLRPSVQVSGQGRPWRSSKGFIVSGQGNEEDEDLVMANVGHEKLLQRGSPRMACSACGCLAGPRAGRWGGSTASWAPPSSQTSACEWKLTPGASKAQWQRPRVARAAVAVASGLQQAAAGASKAQQRRPKAATAVGPRVASSSEVASSSSSSSSSSTARRGDTGVAGV